MKKFLVALLVSTFFFASCQKENVNTKVGSEPIGVSFTASIPDQLGVTKAGTHQGGISNVDFATDYDLRYIIEVWDGTTRVHTEVKTVDGPSSVQFQTRLVPKTYKFIFWADLVTQGSTGDLHYKTDNANGLKEVAFNGTYVGNSDARDAYSYNESIDISSGINKTITLTRPFGKVRILATDVTAQVAGTIGTVKVIYSSKLPNKFDASGSTTPDYTGTATVAFDGSAFNDLNNEQQTLYWDYILAPAGAQATHDFTVSVYDNANTLIRTRVLTNIPVERNKLTTIKGNFFTVSSNFVVNVDDAFVGNQNKDADEVTFANLQAHLNALYTASQTPGKVKAINIKVTDITTAQTVNIPEYNTTDVPNVTINFTQGIGAGNVAFTSTGNYQGKVQFIIPSVTGTFTVNMPNTKAIITGPVSAYIGKLTLTGSQVYFGVGTLADVNTVLAKNTAADTYNKGIILTGDITSLNLANAQDDFEIGNAANSAILAGYEFDGNGHSLTGKGTNNALIVYANNTTIKNLTVTNSVKHGITLYKVTGITIDNVTAKNNGASGITINGSTVATLNNFTAMGNAWGGINLGQGGGVTAIPAITSVTGNLNIADATPVWADFAGASENTFAATGWSCTNKIQTDATTIPFKYTVIWRKQPAGFIVQGFAAKANWLVNRYDVDSWTAVNYYGMAAIKSSITGPNTQSSNFYNTQGRNINVVNASNRTEWVVEGQIYVSASMINTGSTPYYAGLWATSRINVTDLDYPIIAITNTNDDRSYGVVKTPRWRMWKEDGTWHANSGPAVTVGWHKLKIEANGSVINYYIDDVLEGSYGNASSSLETIILQNYNFTQVYGSSVIPGYAFDAYFADVKATIK